MVWGGLVARGRLVAWGRFALWGRGRVHPACPLFKQHHQATHLPFGRRAPLAAPLALLRGKADIEREGIGTLLLHNTSATLQIGSNFTERNIRQPMSQSKAQQASGSHIKVRIAAGLSPVRTHSPAR